MPKVNVFLRNSPEISEKMLVDEITTTPKKDLIIKLHVPCFPMHGPSYLLNRDAEIHRVNIHFDEVEAKRYINLFRKDAELLWIPCNEQLPEYGQAVLVYTKSPDWTQGKIVVGCRTFTDINGEHWAADYAHYITHWMKLPPPPEE